MNKRQMAEWLAENVLGYKAFKDFPELLANDDANPSRLLLSRPKESSIKNVCDFIYSPNGFFAVWDASIKNKFMYFVWSIGGSPYDSDRCTISKLFLSPESTAYGDRYEAFYNAVYEARKQEVNQNDY